jgi:ribosome-binding ATPase YchF (GTP1/OBG family)
MKTAIIGLSSVGKSTLFSLLTGSAAIPSGGRAEARVGIAKVPDARVDRLAEMYQPKKKTYATVDYVDVPGVSKGEGAALVDLPALRGVDALLHVVPPTSFLTPTARSIPCATPRCSSSS